MIDAVPGHRDSVLAEIQRLLHKYPEVGPRYTSYPTAVELRDDFDPAELIDSLESSNESMIPKDLSIYIHLPFCRRLCFYCGCNKIVTRNEQKGQDYLKRLAKEVDLLGQVMDTDRRVMQLHLGGGTPTFFSIAQLDAMLDHLSRRFFMVYHADRDYSIEIDPRTIDRGYIHALSAIGFNRISIGIQDFDGDVQRAIHRVQQRQHIADLVGEARESAIRSVNFDLVYGLPKQTVSGFQRTLDQVVEMDPDRVSVYQYAHMPTRFSAQRRIFDEDLPDTATRLLLQREAARVLGQAGYIHIGMDHYAKNTDSLTGALREGSIQRNFQGYTSHRNSELVGLGVSAIGDIGGYLYQNHKTLPDYYRFVDAARLPVARGLCRSEDDRIREEVIMDIMCRGEVDKAAFIDSTGQPFDQYFAHEARELSRRVADGLLTNSAASLKVTDTGRLMLRTIALVFDRYRRQGLTGATFPRIH